MWESRALREISKSLWKPVCGFHGDVISIAVFAVARCDPRPMLRGCWTLAGLPFVVPGASCAVVSHARARSSVLTSESRFYFVASSVRKSVWTLVRQLRGPHLSTCA